MKLLATQPTFLPWIGYFDLIDQSDVVIFLDDVQFEKRSWQQRNKIKSDTGLQWLTLAVNSKGKRNQLINEVVLDNQKNDLLKITKTLETNYNNAKCFKYYKDSFFEILKSGLQSGNLLNLNLSIIKYFLEKLNIKKSIFLSSESGVNGNKSQKLINICKHYNCNEYISTLGAKEYLLKDKYLFHNSNIDILLHNYSHPKYNQRNNNFEPYASIIDLLFNEGQNSLNILKAGRLDFFKL